MSVLDNVYHNFFKLRSVDNPITLTPNNCKLLNTKKESYYIHKYEPGLYLKNLRDSGISDDYLSRFDETPRDKCCNVISIVLYAPDCSDIGKLSNYLNSINRTVKNSLRNLKDWIVRLYLDESVHQCINNAIEYLKINLTTNPTQRNTVDNQTCVNYFESIIKSPNVEIYTFICEDKVVLEKTRTYRYLTLIDPEVNISAIREADGYVNNLECHNLKMFQNSDKLFYVPPLGVGPNLINETQPKIVFNSYSIWLQLYKNILDRGFFSTHQNIYDLLAGFFSFKLKIKPAFYYTTTTRLHRQIDEFKTLSPNDIVNKYAPEDNSYPLSSMPIGIVQRMTIIMSKNLRELLVGDGKTQFNRLVKFFEQGFDEILLLDIFKELISFEFSPPTEETKWQFTLNTSSIDRIKSLFMSYDSITPIIFNSNIRAIPGKAATPETPLADIIEELKKQSIIPMDDVIPIPGGYMMDVDKNAFIDGKILKNIIANHPFDIKFNPINSSKSVLEALNLYYKQSYEQYYNYNTDAAMKKYLKYKNKYAMLKKKLLQHSA
jgi:hypothetical protein